MTNSNALRLFVLVCCLVGVAAAENKPLESPAPDLVLRGRSLPEPTPDFCYEVNRPWVDANPIPSSFGWSSEYVEYHDIVARRLHELIRSEGASAEVARFVKSYENTRERDRVGLTALQPDLRAVDRLRTRADVARLIARFNRSHGDPVNGSSAPTPTPFYVAVWPDPADSRRQSVQLLQGGLGLPGASYYLGEQSAMVEVREKYRAHVARILDLAGTKGPAQAAARALQIESALARFQYDLVKLQGAQERNRHFTLTQLEEFAPAFDWRTFFREARIDAHAEILVPQAGFIRSATDLLSTAGPEDLRAYFRWQLLLRYSMFLASPYVEASEDFFNRTVQGAEDVAGTSQFAEEYAAIYLPDELSFAYVQRYVTAASRKKALQIAENVRAAFRERIRVATWLSERSRAEAQHKLDRLEIGMLYPDGGGAAQKVSLSETDLVGNLVKLNERLYDEKLHRLERATDRRRWWYPPIGIDGSYSATQNALIITAGRALPPLFDPGADDPANYGGLGTLIGHEMGHALDNQGSQYDADGNHLDWWDADDKREFERRSARLIDQYNRYAPLPDIRLNGEAELSENIGDLVGLAVGYEALQRARKAQGKALTTDDERGFFRAWATRWRVQYARPLLVRILTSDTHPPLQYRCTVPLSNFNRFYEVVGIGTNSPAYLPPTERVSIW